METYLEFLNRISSFEKKELSFGKKFEGNPSIALKVDGNNSFRGFYGDTVVFDLDDTVKAKLAEYVDTLYAATPQCFSEKLAPHTFHMTLHDLSNSPVMRDVAADIIDNEMTVVNLLDEIKKLGGEKIEMKSKYIINMVNTSLVLGLYPANEREYLKLINLYSIFDNVRKLSYPLTPHITLAYYNVNGFDAQSARLLEAAVNRLNSSPLPDFTVGDLYYQIFRSMNDYLDVIKLL